MNLTLDIITGIGGAFVVLWAMLWTYMRFQRIVHNREANRFIKNVFWGLLLIGVIFLGVALIMFTQNS